MTLEKHRLSNGCLRVVMTECAICGADLSDVYYVARHIGTHSPEEVGLSPLRDDGELSGQLTLGDF